MGYVSRAPAPALAPFVESIWWFDGELAPGRERIRHSGNMQLLVNLHDDELRAYEGERFERVVRTRDAALCGAFDRAFAIDTAEQRAICVPK